MDLHIIDLAAGGRGLAKVPDGRVVFVKGALSGEQVIAEVVKSRRDYLEAEATKIIQPSPQRVAPACPVYDSCGGCDLMHLDYPAQIQAKAAWVGQALKRLGKFSEPVPVPSPLPWAYRHRVRFHIKNRELGFFRRKSRDLVLVSSCPVACEAINRLLPELAGLLKQSPVQELAWLEALAGRDGKVFLTAGFQPGFRPGAGQMKKLGALALAAGAFGIRSRRGPWSLSPETGVDFYDDKNLYLLAFPGIFCQVNFEVNRLLIKSVLEEAGPGRGRAALDLYAGSGNFSLPLGGSGWNVLACEGAYEAVEAGRYLAGQNSLQDAVEFMQEDAGRALARLTKQGRKFDLVVLDPPRAGAKGLMPGVAELKPKRVIYVSCHPAALARDAHVLCQAGYDLVLLKLFDMFPQTSQVEVMAVFENGRVPSGQDSESLE